ITRSRCGSAPPTTSRCRRATDRAQQVGVPRQRLTSPVTGRQLPATLRAVRDIRRAGSSYLWNGENMTRSHARYLLLAALLFAPGTSSASPIFGVVPAVYDTVDAVETVGNRIIVTGIVSGESTTSEIIYTIQDSPSGSAVAATRCDRLALLAIAKPGK